MSATDLTPRWIGRLSSSPRPRPHRTFWLAYLAFFAVSSIWALSNPLMANLDEPSHVTKAAATVLRAPDLSHAGANTGIGVVEVPRLFLQLASYPNCFAFNPEAPVSCQQVLVGDVDELALVETAAMNYNPLYYALVGWPALLPGGEHTVYLMRLSNAVLVSGLLAFAVRLVMTMERRRWISLALLVVLTPTLVSLLGSVNPQSFEVAGATLLWVSLLALLRAPDPRYTGLRLLGVVTATVPLANARSLGPLMAVLILLLCILSAPWRRTQEVFHDRRAWTALAVSALACAASLLWTLTQDAFPEGTEPLGLTLNGIFFGTVGLTSAYVQQMFFALGWVDVPAPMWTVFLLVSCVALVAFIGWSLGTFRDRIVLTSGAILVFALPIISHIVQADKIGFFWQGRYAFPLAIGVILLAGQAISHREDLIPDWMSLNIMTTVGLTYVGLHVVSIWLNLHRYAVGASGGWLLRDPLPWIPIPAIVIAAAYATAWYSVFVTVIRAAAPQELISPVGDSPSPVVGESSTKPLGTE